MRDYPTRPSRHRGVVFVAVLVWIVVACLLATSLARGSSSSSSSEPTTAEFVRLAEQVKQHLAELRRAVHFQTVRIAKLRTDVNLLQREAARLSDRARLIGCVLRVWEDASSRLLDAEQVDVRCRDFIAGYVGSGLAAGDVR